MGTGEKEQEYLSLTLVFLFQTFHKLQQNTHTLTAISFIGLDHATEYRQKHEELQSFSSFLPFSWLTPVILPGKAVMLSDLCSLFFFNLNVTGCACSQPVAAPWDVLSSRHSVYALLREMFLWCCSKYLNGDIFLSVSWVRWRRTHEQGGFSFLQALQLYSTCTLLINTKFMYVVCIQ